MDRALIDLLWDAIHAMEAQPDAVHLEGVTSDLRFIARNVVEVPPEK